MWPRELRASSLGTLDWLDTTLAKSPDADMDRAALEMVAGELRSIVATLGRFETRRDHRAPPTLPLGDLAERAAKEAREEVGDHVAVRVKTTDSPSVRGMEEELARSLADVMSYLLDEENEDDEIVVEVAEDDGIPRASMHRPQALHDPLGARDALQRAREHQLRAGAPTEDSSGDGPTHARAERREHRRVVDPGGGHHVGSPSLSRLTQIP